VETYKEEAKTEPVVPELFNSKKRRFGRRGLFGRRDRKRRKAKLNDAKSSNSSESTTTEQKTSSDQQENKVGNEKTETPRGFRRDRRGGRDRRDRDRNRGRGRDRDRDRGRGRASIFSGVSPYGSYYNVPIPSISPQPIIIQAPPPTTDRYYSYRRDEESKSRYGDYSRDRDRYDGRSSSSSDRSRYGVEYLPPTPGYSTPVLYTTSNINYPRY